MHRDVVPGRHLGAGRVPGRRDIGVRSPEQGERLRRPLEQLPVVVGTRHVAEQAAVRSAVVLPNKREMRAERRAGFIGGDQQAPAVRLHDLAALGLVALEVLGDVHPALALRPPFL